jgi:uncharacterized protein (DUF934 family)
LQLSNDGLLRAVLMTYLLRQRFHFQASLRNGGSNLVGFDV